MNLRLKSSNMKTFGLSTAIAAGQSPRIHVAVIPHKFGGAKLVRAVYGKFHFIMWGDRRRVRPSTKSIGLVLIFGIWKCGDKHDDTNHPTSSFYWFLSTRRSRRPNNRTFGSLDHKSLPSCSLRHFPSPPDKLYSHNGSRRVELHQTRPCSRNSSP